MIVCGNGSRRVIMFLLTHSLSVFLTRVNQFCMTPVLDYCMIDWVITSVYINQLSIEDGKVGSDIITTSSESI